MDDNGLKIERIFNAPKEAVWNAWTNEKLVVTDYFSDENGEIMKPEKQGQEQDFPEELIVTVLFEDLEEGKSKLIINYPKPDSKEAVEAMIKSGMKQGWESSLNKMAKVVE